MQSLPKGSSAYKHAELEAKGYAELYKKYSNSTQLPTVTPDDEDIEDDE
jgi:hypothetical protein